MSIDAGLIKNMSDEMLMKMKDEGKELEDADEKKIALRWALVSSSSKMKENFLKEAQHLNGIPVKPDALDAYPMLFNCDNGIINLEAGELEPHAPSKLMSQFAPAPYSKSEVKPVRWLKFLNEICAGNTDLVNYLQRCVGYSLTGSTKEQCIFFLYGEGSNGKSTFLDIVKALMGDYAKNAESQSIMARRQSGSSASGDIARLKGARLVTTSESKEGAELNEALVKHLTGGEAITTRFLFGNEFEYTPQYKIWVATNHKPVINGSDYGIWRRIKMIPFLVTFDEAHKDPDLKDKLMTELPQILEWAVEGSLLWQKEGLCDPQIVLDAVEEYKREMNSIELFYDECIETDYDSTIGGSELYRAYQMWSRANGHQDVSITKFGKEIIKKIPNKTKTHGVNSYRGVKFNAEVEPMFNPNSFSKTVQLAKSKPN
jgi:putative DNA primase/helicase